jgi:hypothetical protein
VWKYKGLYTKSVRVKGESIEVVRDPGARIQEGQDRGFAKDARIEIEIEGIRTRGS